MSEREATSPERSRSSVESSRLSSGILETRSYGEEMDEDDSFPEELDDSLQDRASTISGRGALIRGLNISGSSTSSSSKGSTKYKTVSDEDVESGIHPPDSDYARYIPPSLFPSLSSNSSRKKKKKRNKDTEESKNDHAEGPVGRRSNVTPSIWSSSTSSWDEKFKRPTLWYALACISVLMIGAVIALSVVLTGQKNRDPMTDRQKEISDVISSITDTNAFMDASSPCLLYTSPSPRDLSTSRMPSSA